MYIYIRVIYVYTIHICCIQFRVIHVLYRRHHIYIYTCIYIYVYIHTCIRTYVYYMYILYIYVIYRLAFYMFCIDDTINI